MGEDEATDIYNRAKKDIKNAVRSLKDMITPNPMEVDQIGRVTGEVWEGDWVWWPVPAQEEEAAGDDAQKTEDEDENNINYVGKAGDSKGKGKGRCWACGEQGHRAAECPKAGKDKGEGRW